MIQAACLALQANAQLQTVLWSPVSKGMLTSALQYEPVPASHTWVTICMCSAAFVSANIAKALRVCSTLCVYKADLFCVTPSPLLVAPQVDEVALKRLVHCRFWRQYLNTDALVAELGIQPYTGWAESQFFSPAGLEVTAPVLQSKPRLPTPLGAPALHSDFLPSPPRCHSLFHPEHIRLKVR